MSQVCIFNRKNLSRANRTCYVIEELREFMEKEKDTRLDIESVKQRIQDFKRGETRKRRSGEGLVLLKVINKGTTSTGKPKFSGIISNDEDIRFNIWDNSQAFEYFEDNNVQAGETVLYIKYTIGKYGLVIKDAISVEE